MMDELYSIELYFSVISHRNSFEKSMVISSVKSIMNVTLARGNSALHWDEIRQSYVISLAYLKLQFNIIVLVDAA
jgi:hypothetical protein